MGGRRPRTRNPGYAYDKDQFERDWDARELKVQVLKDAGVPERQASELIDRIAHGPPVFDPRTTRRERYRGRTNWKTYQKSSGRNSERDWFLKSRENYRRAVAEVRLAQLRPRKLAARAAGRASVNMRREFLYTEHEEE